MGYSTRKRHIRRHRRGRKGKSSTKRVRFAGGYGPGSDFVGAPITPGHISGWAGVAGSNQGTYYKPSSFGVPAGNFDPSRSTRLNNQAMGMNLAGGRRRKSKNRPRSRSRSRSKRGGMALVPQDVTNIGRGLLNNLYSTVAGTEGVPYFNQNPLPYKQDGLLYANNYISPPNVFKIHQNMGNSVAHNSNF